MSINQTVHTEMPASPSPNRLRGLWQLLAGFRGHYLIAVITLGIAAIAKTATYYLVRYLIDDVIGQEQYNLLFMVALGFVGLASFESIFSFWSGRLAAQTSESIARRLRDYLFDHIQRLSFTYHDQTSTGDLIQRVTSDVDAIRKFFAQQAIGIGRITLLFTVNLIAIAFINGRLAILSVMIIPLILIMSIYFFHHIAERFEEYQGQQGRVSTVLQENLSGVRVVRAFARQAYEIDKFEKESHSQFVKGRRVLWMHTLYWPLTDILAGGQMVFAFYMGARMAIEGDISAGSYLAFAGMVIWIIWPIRNLGRLLVDMSRAMVSYHRLAEVMRQERVDLVQAQIQPTNDLKGDIRFKEVCFQYRGGEMPALQNINLHVQVGESIALLGGAGSGKSSLVSLLPRFYDLTKGTILIDGTPITDYSRQYLRQQIGIVEQEPFLFSRTIRENITYGVGRDVSNEEVAVAARAAAIHDVITNFPDGYQTLVGEKGVTLSGGQKQRIAIARTLLKNPRILILDDATASVDTETEAAIRTALDKLLPGRTTFIITHRAQTAMVAEKIVVLDKGKIVQEGTHEELLQQAGMYREIYELQSKIEADLEADIAGTFSP